MTERNVSRPWTEDEDNLLRQGIALYGENDNWKNVATLVPGRSNKACRKRWLHSLQPNVKKTAWTVEEDDLLLDLYEQSGPKWSAIARQIPGRTDDACSKRYREALDPNLKKDQWTPEEDQHLLDAYMRIGGKWGRVGGELRRSGLACRNRWRLLERKKASARQSQSHTLPEQNIQVHDLSTFTGFPESESFHIPEQHWPPYYPPEAYPAFNCDADTIGGSFREPTPEQLDKPDPKIAPFQFSSSSLSAALSDPPRPPAPLPTISLHNTPEVAVQDIFQDTEAAQSLSPLSQLNTIPEMCDILMSQPNDFNGQIDPPQVEVPLTQLTFDDSFSLGRFNETNFYTSASPIFIPADLSRNQEPLHPLQFSMWRPRSIPETDFDSPRSTVDSRSLINDDFSSASSTPFGFTTPLSPGSSPWLGTIMELPNPNIEPPSSLLFSSSNDSSTSLLQRTRKSRKNKPAMKTSPVTRLSSILPLEPDLKPYACGRPTCWPAGEKTSQSCFSTSGELLDHTKDAHADEGPAEKPYRCALPGCDKSWKSINGLQYHLQISTAHFVNALSSRFSMQHPATPDQNLTPLSGDDEEGEQERRFTCPLPGCYKAYRQTSGLRYHMKHGHPPDLPAQLNVVPPALERAIPIKAKKLRPKPPPEAAPL